MITPTDIYQFVYRTIFAVLPDYNITESLGKTVIDVSNMQILRLKNTGAVAVTKLTGGVEGQHLRVRGDGQTTFDNNADINTSTGANKLLSLNKYYSFTCDNNVWIEHQT